MSWTIRLTSGSVRFASASAKNLANDDPCNVFGMRDEPDDLLVAIQHDDRRSDVMIGRVSLLGHPEPLKVGIRLYRRRVGPGVIGGRAVCGIVTGADTAGDDVAIRDGAEIVPVFRIVDDGDNRDVLDAHERGDFG